MDFIFPLESDCFGEQPTQQTQEQQQQFYPHRTFNSGSIEDHFTEKYHDINSNILIDCFRQSIDDDELQLSKEQQQKNNKHLNDSYTGFAADVLTSTVAPHLLEVPPELYRSSDFLDDYFSESQMQLKCIDIPSGKNMCDVTSSDSLSASCETESTSLFFRSELNSEFLPSLGSSPGSISPSWDGEMQPSDDRSSPFFIPSSTSNALSQVSSRIDSNSGLCSSPKTTKPVACDICDAVLSRPDALKIHKESLHNGVKYECMHCGVQLGSAAIRRRHIATLHEKNISNMFVCYGIFMDETTQMVKEIGCLKCFNRSEQLKSHWNTGKAKAKCGMDDRFDKGSFSKVSELISNSNHELMSRIKQVNARLSKSPFHADT